MSEAIPDDAPLGPEYPVEALAISKRYRPRLGGAVARWLERRRVRRAPADDLGLGRELDQDLEEEEDDDDEVVPARGGDREVWALRDVTFSLAPGSVLGVMGGDGAGKSTLINVLAGVTMPTAGDAVIRGRVAPTIAAGAIFLDGHKNAAQCIQQVARLFRIPRSVAIDAIDPVRDFTELGRAFDLPVRTYSSGERRRLASAISLFLDPDVLLADEVLAAGDGPFRERCMAELRRRIDVGLTVVVATQDSALVRSFCTSVLLLREGHVEAFGDVGTVLGRHDPKGVPMRARKAATQSKVGPEPARESAAMPTAGSGVTVRSAAIFDMAGRPVSVIDAGEESYAEVRFDVHEPPKRLACVLALSTGDSTPIRLSQREPFLIETGGTFTATVLLPVDTLHEGRHTAKALVLQADGGQRTSLGQATFNVEVVGGDGDEPLRDVSRRAAAWQLVRLGDSDG